MNIRLSHEFVEFVPETLQPGVLYASLRYATVVHRCCCGCGMEVVTPLSPTDWSLTFDGESISLYPSIGNWNYPCQSHYWITNNSVRWARPMSPELINSGRAHDQRTKHDYYGNAAITEPGVNGEHREYQQSNVLPTSMGIGRSFAKWLIRVCRRGK